MKKGYFKIITISTIIFWIINIVFFEVLIYYTWFWFYCDIPKDKSNFVFIADPQITDKNSYSFARNGVLLSFINIFCDMYMKKSFSTLLNYKKNIDSIFFLGVTFF
jgi:hypothetical protein